MKILPAARISRSRSRSKMYYKCCNNTIPMYFRGMFPAQSTRHTHNTRAGSNPIMHHFNTAGGRYSIRHFVPELLRQTPSCITDKIETHSLQGVARYAKTYYLSQYKAVCNIPNCYICHRVWLANMKCFILFVVFLFVLITSLATTLWMYCEFISVLITFMLPWLAMKYSKGISWNLTQITGVSFGLYSVHANDPVTPYSQHCAC